jgi:hypothetical protein
MISFPTILRAAVRRFIPGVLAFLGCCLYFSARVSDITLGPPQVEGLTNLVVFMTLGFGTTLHVMRRVLPRGARVDGWRSAAAGFAAPAVLLTLEMLHGGPGSHSLNYALAFVAGGCVSLASFVRRIDLRSAMRRSHIEVGPEATDDSDPLPSQRANGFPTVTRSRSRPRPLTNVATAKG